MDTEIVKKVGWWSRNWKWFLPTAVLAVIVIGVLSIGTLAYFVFALMRSTDAYKMALKQVQEDTAVVSTFGGPVEPRWYLLGSVNTSGSNGSTSLQIPVYYGEQYGYIYVEATKSLGKWTIHNLVVTANESGKRLVLIDRNRKPIDEP